MSVYTDIYTMKIVVVVLSDQKYFEKAKRTILDTRTRGCWTGSIVWITVGFDAPQSFLEQNNVIQRRVEHLDTSHLLEAYTKEPLKPTTDNRTTGKLTQWDKFYVFDQWFSQWDRVIYLDAGLRVFDSINHLLDLDCTGLLMAPDDAPANDTSKRFGVIIETAGHPHITEALFKEYDPQILGQRYFLNCMWIYDTVLLQKITIDQLIDAMNKYPICRCNEMTIMNLIFNFKYKVWKAFPDYCLKNPSKHLFGWTEHDRDYGRQATWRDFCFVKYPSTIKFNA